MGCLKMPEALPGQLLGYSNIVFATCSGRRGQFPAHACFLRSRSWMRQGQIISMPSTSCWIWRTFDRPEWRRKCFDQSEDAVTQSGIAMRKCRKHMGNHWDTLLNMLPYQSVWLSLCTMGGGEEGQIDPRTSRLVSIQDDTGRHSVACLLNG